MPSGAPLRPFLLVVNTICRRSPFNKFWTRHPTPQHRPRTVRERSPQAAAPGKRRLKAQESRTVAGLRWGMAQPVLSPSYRLPFAQPASTPVPAAVSRTLIPRHAEQPAHRATPPPTVPPPVTGCLAVASARRARNCVSERASMRRPRVPARALQANTHATTSVSLLLT